MTFRAQDYFLLFITILLVSIGNLATNLYLPALPSMQDYFQTSSILVQGTISAYFLSFCLTPLVLGPLTDRINRGKLLRVGISISMLATLLCSIAHTIGFLIFARFVQGIGLGFLVSISRTILPSYFQGRPLIIRLSYITMFTPLILALGPVIGGIIVTGRVWQMIFLFFFAYLICIWFFISFFEREVSPQQTVSQLTFRNYYSTYKLLFKSKRFMTYSICSTLFFIGIAAFITVSPFLTQSLFDLTPSDYGLLAGAILSSNFFSGWANSQLIQYYKPQTLLYCANVLMLGSGIMLMLFGHYHLLHYPSFIIISMLYFFAAPMSFANASALALQDIESKNCMGAATAFMMTLQYFGGICGSIFISLSNQDSVIPLGFLFTVLSVFYYLGIRMGNQ